MPYIHLPSWLQNPFRNLTESELLATLEKELHHELLSAEFARIEAATRIQTATKKLAYVNSRKVPLARD